MAKTSKLKFDPEEFLAKADGGVTISKYNKGQVIFSQGDSADCVLYIREGRVKIAVLSAQGKEAVVAFLKAGDFIGEGCLTGRPRRVSTAQGHGRFRNHPTGQGHHGAEVPTTSGFLRTVHGASFGSHDPKSQEDLVDQLFNSSEKRLARALLLLANFGKDGKREPVIAKVSQETLADMIGTTRSRVSHFMNKFRQLGYIDYNGAPRGPHLIVGWSSPHEKPQIKTTE